MMLHILNAEPEGYSPQARQILATIGAVEDDHTLSREELLARIPRADVLIVRLGHTVDEPLLARAARLKVVVSATTGVDHLDLQAMRARGIAALTLRGETAFLQTVTATAEHTWGLLLALQRKLKAAMMMGASGLWDRDQLRGHELRGATLGIVGYGRLGRMVAQYGRAFGMRVLVFDPYVQVEDFTQVDSLQALCARSDVISLHVPLNEETRHLFDAAIFAQCKAGAVLINTSRGAVIDSAALLAALRAGQIGGAALDVVDGELSPESLPAHPLLQYAREHDNLIITPHIGGATVESMAKTEAFMAQKLYDYCRDQGWLGSR